MADVDKDAVEVDRNGRGRSKRQPLADRDFVYFSLVSLIAVFTAISTYASAGGVEINPAEIAAVKSGVSIAMFSLSISYVVRFIMTSKGENISSNIRRIIELDLKEQDAADKLFRMISRL